MELTGLAELANKFGDTRSSDRTPFPLAAYLTLYSKAPIECRNNNMEGARTLKSWLGPIEFDPAAKLSGMPELLQTYEFEELVKLLSPMKFGQGDWLSILKDTEEYMFYALVAECRLK